ncbi:HD domain-containing protein [Brevibacillus nitrificans]|uniref:HD domain-containing protein n=1 Tax=Brevibacillus nitrificans TaxID=651560 RepID=A0A3M8D570_9BACL|nr:MULTISPECIES: HD domain-containing phosphohydrolase [Brevibacillus]MED1950126.1 HD domain-containing phosphohydrolase [Brevibacillus centrosporus]RNB83234.1 HD domain-containing protein [Brevibacillus nitrificans]
MPTTLTKSIYFKMVMFWSVTFLFATTGCFYTFSITQSWEIPFLACLFYLSLACFFTKYWIELPYKGYYSGSAIPILLATVDVGLWFGGVICIFTSLCTFIIYRHSLRTEALNFLQYWISLLLVSLFLDWGKSLDTNSIWLYASLLMIAMFLYELTSFILVSFYDWASSNKSFLWTDVKDYAKEAFMPVLISIVLIPWPYINMHYDRTYYLVSLPILVGLFLLFGKLVNSFNRMRMKTNSLVESFGEMIDQKTNRTHHAIQVGKIAVLIGEKVGLSPKELDVLFHAATLHDIGKTALLDHLWTRRGKFTVAEEKEYRTHVNKGAEIIKSIKGLESMSTIILHQHEHYDGSGFPDGLKGEEIPLYSRIIRIASRIDRLQVTPPSRSLTEALSSLGKKELDPHLVEICKTINISGLYPENNTPVPPSKAYDFITEIKNELYSSELTKHIDDLQIMMYSQQSLQMIDGGVFSYPIDTFKSCIDETLKYKKTKRDIVRFDNNQLFGVTCIPWEEENVLIIAHQLSEILHYEQTQKQILRNIYRDVLHAATQGKLEIIDHEEFQTRFFDFTLPVLIRVKEDIALARQPFMDFLNGLSVSKELKMKILLCVNEALTNVIKHADMGRCGFRLLGELLEYSISDNGNGINLETLPKSTLLKGFSTQHSMGHGFKLMIQYCDHIVLSTGNQGTSILMQFRLDESGSPKSSVH